MADCFANPPYLTSLDFAEVCDAGLSAELGARRDIFFTVALLERKRDWLVAEIGLLDSVRRVKRLHLFHIVAWVVLPDHLHATA